MTYGRCTDQANTFIIYILAGSYDFCRVVTAEVLTFLVPKNDSAPALLYSKYRTAPKIATACASSGSLGISVIIYEDCAIILVF